MVVEFDELSDESRLWIYQINRDISIVEEEDLLNDVIQFLRDWTAHGSKLAASVKIIDHRILIIAADESYSNASGCSIDSQVAFLRELQLKLDIDLFSRNTIFYRDEEGFKTMDLNVFKHQIAIGQLSDETLFFNTTIHKKEQLKDGFIIPVKESWLMRMIGV
jgi:hypothetical protein